MRRRALFIVGGAVWLFLAAIPALADGGPHVATTNSGVSTLTSDSCAGCHRAHTAQGALLLKASSEEELCLSCHGAAGTGASTDVESGVQYTLAQGRNTGTPVLGALRNGGFVEARIDSGDPYRVAYNRFTGTPPTVAGISYRAKVSVLGDGEPVTSSHLDLDGEGGVVSSGKAWGNGAVNTGSGPVVDLSCASCHNPHGNGQYRILNPIPNPTAHAGNTFTAVASPGVTVTDAPVPPVGETRNYTVIQAKGGTGSLLASQVLALPGYSNEAGDYLHRTVPWDPGVSYTDPIPAADNPSNDAPNGQAATFNTQITAWCSSCHTRYNASTNPNPEPGGTPATGQSWRFPRPGEPIFKYQHQTTTNRACTTCHVSHGSNAVMDSDPTTPGNQGFSATMEYPGGAAAPVGDSRLLKIDNRGTCQACHDPTGTVVAGQSSGTAPTPFVP